MNLSLPTRLISELDKLLHLFLRLGPHYVRQGGGGSQDSCLGLQRRQRTVRVIAPDDLC